MGKFNFIIFSLLFFFLASTHAQWQTDVRLTNAQGTSFTGFNNARCIATNGNTLHIVWRDDRDSSSGEIYYKRSTNAGVTWGADTRLTNNSANSELPAIAVSGSVVHVTWQDSRNGFREIYYKLSTNGGVTWGADTRLTNKSALSQYPSIAVSGSLVPIVWFDNRDGNNEIYSKKSTNGGLSWDSDLRLTNNNLSSTNPSVDVNGNLVQVVWMDDRDGNFEIYQKRSIDGGGYWGIDNRLTNNTGFSSNPSVAISGTDVHVVWWDSRDGNAEIYYKRSSNSGYSFGADTRLTNNSAFSENPSVAVSNQFIHVVWWDSRDGNNEIYYKRSTNNGVTWGTDTRLTNNTASSTAPFISISGNALHVAWTDERDGNPEIYYKRNPTGNIVGLEPINSEVPNEYYLFQNYPNPFNPTTNIKYSIAKSGFVTLNVFDVMGREVAALVNGKMNVGNYEVTFNGENLNSGIYFYKLITNDFTETKRMMLIK